MKHFPHPAIIHLTGFLFVIVVFTNCKKEFISTTPSQLSPESIPQSVGGNALSSASTISETRTANSWFNVNNSRYERWGTQYVAADDNSYAYTGRINKLQRVYLILQDFDFTIPSNAVIENIIVSVSRFKSGNGAVKDCFVHLLTNNNYGNWLHYGVEMANTIDPWPVVEEETSYSQKGSGNNGIKNTETHTTQPYQWTPALVNNSIFGLYLLTNFPDKGYCYLYFDKVAITVEYSLP